MENQLTINNDYNSLDKLLQYINTQTNFEGSKEYDHWDMRTDANGQLEHCIIVKKSAMHGMKVYFSEENSLQMSYIIPNKIMNAYFGKSQKRYRNILEIVAGGIKNALLASSQKKAYLEMEEVFFKIAA